MQGSHIFAVYWIVNSTTIDISIWYSDKVNRASNIWLSQWRVPYKLLSSEQLAPAVGQLQSCLEVLKVAKGEGTAELAEATTLADNGSGGEVVCCFANGKDGGR